MEKINEVNIKGIDRIGSMGKKLVFPKSIVILIFTIVVVTVAQLVGNEILIGAAMIFYLITMLTASEEELFPFFLFFLPWSPILKMNPTSISFASIALIFVFFKYIFIKKPYIDVKLIIPVIGIVFFSLVVKVIQNYELTTGDIMFLILFIAFPYLFNCVKNKINFTKCIEFFAIGIVLAAVVSGIFVSNDNLAGYVKIFSQKNTGVTRLCGFYGDPNFYSAQIVTAVGGLLIVLSGKEKSIFNILLTIALVAVGLVSISKSYILCMLLVFVLWELAVLFHKPSRFFAIIIIIVIAVFVMIASGLLDEVISEYLIRFDSASGAESLTTGRSIIWVNYLTFLLNNPFDLFFGQGCTSAAMVVKSSHNTLIQLIYQFGIFGCFILIFWFRYIFTRYNKKNLNIKIFVYSLMWIAACFSMWLGLDMLFFDDFFLIIILCSLGMKTIREQFIGDK